MTNTAYENARNKLIPVAVAAAKIRLSRMPKRSEPRPGIDGEPYDHCFFTEYFHEEMEKLAEGLK